MKLPLCWLRDYVDFEDTVEGLAAKLTFSGIEVEGIETIGSDHAGVIVGEVKAVNRHPNADRLTVCIVSDGKQELEVVCGAPNVAAGGKYPFAPIGTTLANGMTLKKTKIRGVESQGMLCAEDELGISEDHTGLMVLDSSCRTGAPLSEILGPPQTVLELEITPNRPDCLSMMGVAREVAALYGAKLKRPDVSMPETNEPAESLTRVAIEDPERCPRYTARILKGVKIAPSPEWMTKRLTLAGVRPINNVVDITNFVMIECGHPLHAFDQMLLDEGRIVVRRARAGEKMATLDGAPRELTADMLVIADARQPVAVAGVMGGAGSEIRDTTRTVLLESAYFQPDGIRRTSKALALSTESSYRFERGTDIEGAEWASRRAASLMVQLAGAACANGLVDAYPKRWQERKVVCRREPLESLLGIRTTVDDMARIFQSLELPVVEKSADACSVIVPSFRTDIEREVDLIEEFARIHGLDKIPSPPPRSEIIPGAEDHRTRAKFACRANLVALGLREIANYSLVSPAALDLFDHSDAGARIVLPNPISADQSILRTTLVPQMMATLGHNRARQIAEAAFFEMGRVYFKDGPRGTREEERVSIGIMGPVGRDALDKRRPIERQEMFLWMKGIVESLFAVQRVRGFGFRATACPWLEAGLAVAVTIEGEEAGMIGVVIEAVRAPWRFAEPVAVAELKLEPLLKHVFDIREQRELAAFPPVQRDIALIVDKTTRHEDVLNVIRKAAPKELENVSLFDIFESEAMGSNRKSMAYALTYRSSTKTLTDEEANSYHAVMQKALQKELNAEIRDS